MLTLDRVDSSVGWRKPVATRFWNKVDKNGPIVNAELGSCWSWTAGCCKKGYGTFVVYEDDVRRTVGAHRVAYRLIIGPVPEGMTLDHLCRNRACVNPAHLDPVTNRVNILRGFNHAAQNARKTHCKYGHELTPENTLVAAPSRPNRRDCLTCHLAKLRTGVTKQRTVADEAN